METNRERAKRKVRQLTGFYFIGMALSLFYVIYCYIINDLHGLIDGLTGLVVLIFALEGLYIIKDNYIENNT
jgi:hypothetical protein